jgi:hypothetical protein
MIRSGAASPVDVSSTIVAGRAPAKAWYGGTAGRDSFAAVSASLARAPHCGTESSTDGPGPGFGSSALRCVRPRNSLRGQRKSLPRPGKKPGQDWKEAGDVFVDRCMEPDANATRRAPVNGDGAPEHTKMGGRKMQEIF